MAADYEEEQERPYVSARELRLEQFRALGGGRTLLDDIYEYRKAPLISEMVTDTHRDLVLDLRMSGLSHEAISVVMGISKPQVQKHFAWELEAGTNIGQGVAARGLLHNAMSGDTAAQIGFLKNHPELTWGTKSEVTGKDGKDLVPASAQSQSNAAFLADLISGLAVDPTKRRAATRKSPAKATAAPVPINRAMKKTGYTKVQRKPKQEN